MFEFRKTGITPQQIPLRDYINLTPLCQALSTMKLCYHYLNFLNALGAAATCRGQARYRESG